MANDAKPAIRSTQNWANILTVGVTTLLSASPDAQKFLSEHTWLAPLAIGMVNVVWRTFITKTPVEGIFK